ncbi:hypothetical protein PAAG_08046 [Paracoccidioides lutzii Pb01]|uniref:Uncharacterized protein n=1 Tax=Paracoccidioides lutzii (strain ATCC MYA-826 / Pb01) TaxID=502779 RepID=C1HBA5_PARBA|nr:hypothetical protein PAAG_08046 [Paracoccidioides lutzii Pb01]EEH37628.2 hypothetical protein PAAG_08046 [Paracoccidioides lutzii Pb01]
MPKETQPAWYGVQASPSPTTRKTLLALLTIFFLRLLSHTLSSQNPEQLDPPTPLGQTPRETRPDNRRLQRDRETDHARSSRTGCHGYYHRCEGAGLRAALTYRDKQKPSTNRNLPLHRRHQPLIPSLAAHPNPLNPPAAPNRPNQQRRHRPPKLNTRNPHLNHPANLRRKHNLPLLDRARVPPPPMLKANHGHIITVASMASFLGLGGMAPYSCSKASAMAFHEALGQEVKLWYRADKVRTSIVFPYWVRTGMVRGLTGRGGRDVGGMPVMDVEEVSGAVVKLVLGQRSGQVILPEGCRLKIGATRHSLFTNETLHIRKPAYNRINNEKSATSSPRAPLTLNPPTKPPTPCSKTSLSPANTSILPPFQHPPRQHSRHSCRKIITPPLHALNTLPFA